MGLPLYALRGENPKVHCGLYNSPDLPVSEPDFMQRNSLQTFERCLGPATLGPATFRQSFEIISPRWFNHTPGFLLREPRTNKPLKPQVNPSFSNLLVLRFPALCKQSSYKLTASGEALDSVHNSRICTGHILFLASCSVDVEEEKGTGGKVRCG